MTPTNLAYFVLGALTGAVLVIAATVLALDHTASSPEEEAEAWPT